MSFIYEFLPMKTIVLKTSKLTKKDREVLSKYEKSDNSRVFEIKIE